MIALQSLRSDRPLFWIILSVVAVSSILFSFKYFSKAFSILDIDITMDREGALQKSKKLAELYNFQPGKESRSVAWFATDSTVQNYTELEAGGVEAFRKLLHDKDYTPHTWHVRQFKENFIPETYFSFRPDGTPYSFNYKIPNEEEGAALTAEKARIIALEQLSNWHVDLSNYKELDNAQHTNTAGRIDHTFTYEHLTKKVGNAPYRIELKVQGTTFTSLYRFIKIPEDFIRRYQEMRSANNTIASTASLFMTILYVILGCLGGLFFLFKRNLLIVKFPIIWGFFSALLVFLENFNNLPLAWINYATWTSPTVFLFTKFSSLIISFGWSWVQYTLIFIVAEGLTRAAFGKHPQLWSSLTQPGNKATGVIGRFVGGYLYSFTMLAYIIATYCLTTTFLKWWSPAEALYDPNILASYAPWFPPLAISWNAGFIEECLFRAIPLAGAALLARRYSKGKEAWFVGIALLVQAFIFGAAHANYPAQPAYARVIELILPSLMFGIVYLRYGLLATITCHFTFDVILFSLPVFACHATGIWVSKMLVIVGTLLPLLWALYCRFTSSATSFPLLYNKDWHAKVSASWNTWFNYDAQNLPTTRHPLSLYLITCLGFFGLIAWGLTTRFKADAPHLVTPWSEKKSHEELKKREKVDLPSSWSYLPKAYSNVQSCYTDLAPDQTSAYNQRIFIWRHHRSQFHPLLTTYLNPVLWHMRYATFEGNVVDRAEQYVLTLSADGALRTLCHRLAEGTAATSLTETQARSVAHGALSTLFNLQASEVKEITATPQQLPNRTDWTFIWQDPKISVTPGEARIGVHIAGDKIVDYYRFIFTPQEWVRNFNNEQALLHPIRMISYTLLYLIVLIIFIATYRHPIAISIRKASILFLIIGGLFFIETVNKWPQVKAYFSTAEPYSNQFFNFASWAVLKLIAVSALIVLCLFLVRSVYNAHKSSTTSKWYAVFGGFSLAALWAGIAALTHYFTPSVFPLLPELTHLGKTLPLFGLLLENTYDILLYSGGFIMSCCALNRLTNRWYQHHAYGIVLIIIGSLSFIGIGDFSSIGGWLLTSILTACGIWLIYFYIARFNHQILVWMAIGMTMLFTLQQACFNAYAYSWIDYALATLSAPIIGLLLVWFLNNPEQERA